MLKNKRFLICSGGTGGHVIPAVNFGNFLIDRGYECSLILDKRGAKYSNGFKGKIFLIYSSHLSGNIFFKIKSIFFLFFGFINSFIHIIKFKPHYCISFGSYATFSSLTSLLILKNFIKINFYIHEQNSIIGNVNLLFLRHAKYLFTNFEKIQNLKKKFIDKKIFVGFPSSQNYKKTIPNYNFNKDKVVIFIYGGSQGASSIINIFLSILNKLKTETLKKIKIIIQSPKNNFFEIKKITNNLNIDTDIKEFYENIDEILNISDIAITRSGAGTINDLIRYNLPSIIFPLINSKNNHQVHNANFLYELGGSICLNENQFDILESCKIFEEMINDEKKRKNMIMQLCKISLPNANQLMLNKIIK